MSTRQVVERKERSMAELLIIVVMIGVLASVFMNSFFKQEEHISKTAFESLLHTFASKVQVVHGQWMMDRQPNIVELSTLNTNDVDMITVNKSGWIDKKDSSTPCHDIWSLAMEIPLIFMNQPIGVVEISHANGNTERICQYSISDDLSFEYHASTGKVTM